MTSTEGRTGFAYRTFQLRSEPSYGTHQTARRHAHSQVFTENHKKCLGRGRLAARSRHFHSRECAVSLARSRSKYASLAHHPLTLFSVHTALPHPRFALFFYTPSFSLRVFHGTNRYILSVVREMARRLTSSSSPIRRFSTRGLTPSAARSSGPSPGSSST